MSRTPDPHVVPRGSGREGAAGETTHPRPDTFVGRQHELRSLADGLDAALAGRTSLHLIAGEPGIGKTRLAAEIAHRASERGAEVAWGRCWEEAGAPAFWPWVQVLRACVRDRTELVRQLDAASPLIAHLVPELRDLMPAPVEPLLHADSEAVRFRLFDAVSRLLDELARSRPLLLVFDDLQWSDEPSLLLLQFVARQLRDARLLLVGAYRDVEARLAPGVERRLRVLAENGRSLTLAGLEPTEVRRLIETTSGRSAGEAVAAAIHRASGGNPLFVEEIVRLSSADGTSLDPSSRDGLPVPGRVREVILRRVGHLSNECRRVLTLAALVGREFDISRLEAVSDVSAALVLELVSEARTARLVVEVAHAPGRFAFDHDLVRETLLEQLSYDERVRMHGDIGEAFERAHQSNVEPHLAELAHHFFHAAPSGTGKKALDYATRAAERAARQLAYEDAARQYERALHALDLADPGDGARRAHLLLALGETLWSTGDFERAKAAYLEAADLADSLGLPEVMARAALGFDGPDVGLEGGTVNRELITLLEKGLAALGDREEALSAALMARLACSLTFTDQRERCGPLARRGLEIARRLGDPATLFYVLNCFVFATWGPDNLEERLAVSHELSDLATQMGSTDAGEIHAAVVSHLIESGDRDAADREAEAYCERARRSGRRIANWRVAVRRVSAALRDGKFADVETLASEALAIGQEAQNRNAGQLFGAQLISLRREQGRLDEVVTAVEGLAAAYPAVPSWRAAVAWVHAELGHEAEARRDLDRLAARGYTDLPRDMLWLLTMWLLAEMAGRLGDAGRAEQLLELLQPYAGRAVIAGDSFFGGSVERSLGLCAAAVERLDEAARHYEAAIAANSRLRSPPWVAHSQHDYARLLLTRGAAGDRERAAELAGRAVETARSLGMTALLARAEPLLAEAAAAVSPAGGDALFRREGEYWTLAYEGKTVRLRDARGLGLIAVLLRHPGTEFHAADLDAGPGAADPTATQRALREGLSVGRADAGDELIDPQAKAEYRARIQQLRQEIDAADQSADTVSASRARAELEALERELLVAVNLRVRTRRRASEGLRLRVTKAIRASIRRIDRQHPDLGEHLARAIRTGTFCSYQPPASVSVRWTF